MSAFLLPSRLGRTIKNLAIIYSGSDSIANEILTHSSFHVQENVTYDNYNGGTCGHAVHIFVSEHLLKRIGTLSGLRKLEEKLRDDLNQRLVSIPNEYVATVSLELFDEANEECQNSSNVYHNRVVKADVSHIWKEGFIRLFISHRDSFKAEAATLKAHLESYGISCFVAHDNIIPMTEWQDEIENALFTMDALLIMLTDDFHASNWTDQEIGVAIGRNVPICPLRLESTNPYGFISKYQAIKSNLQDLKSASKLVFQRLCESSIKKDAIKDALIERFITSKSYEDSIFFLTELMPLITAISTNDIAKIQNGFNKNDQLYTCIVVNRELPKKLKEVTGKDFMIRGRELVEL